MCTTVGHSELRTCIVFTPASVPEDAVAGGLPYTVVMSSSSSGLFSTGIKKPTLLENVVYSRSLNSVKLEQTVTSF